jgi:hypothetical protein
MDTEVLLPTVYGLPGTGEYRAAEQLRNIIAQAALPAAIGTVSIHTNLHFTGQRRGQIDLVLHAHFPSGLTRKVHLQQSSETIDVAFRDILAVIEVKGHDTDVVNLNGLHALVHYRNSGWKDASEQSHRQAFGAKSFIKNHLRWKPYVCNLIFFPRLLQSDLPTYPHNYLASGATFDDLLAQLCLIRKLNPDSHTSTPLRFSCTYAKDEAVVAEQYTQLRQLLGTHRPEPSSPAAPRMSATPISKPLSDPSLTNNWTTAPPPPPYGHFKRRQIFVLGIVCLFVVSALTILYSAKVAQLSQTENPVATVATCRHITSAGDCDAKASFRTGSTVLIQLLGTQQTPVSALIRDPLGNSFPLIFLVRNQPLNATHPAKNGLVAKYVLGRHATPGSYTIQITVQGEGKKAEQPLTSSFDVTR